MPTNFIISDTHFGHSNIILYENRPFPDKEEMDWQIITRWNKVVKQTDTVYHLGDFGLASKERYEEILKQLNGKKYLVMGNHDRCRSPKWWRERGFDEVSKYPIIKSNFFILSHEPVYLPYNSPYFNIHGHLHSKTMKGEYYNVGVELHNYTPISLDELLSKPSKIWDEQIGG
jgi:calcineurin-like phosphoesterase family protein